MRFFLILIISLPCYGFDFFESNPLNETPPQMVEPPERNRLRAINMAQRAMFAYPEPRRLRRSVEQKFDQLVGKEFAATLGVIYVGYNNQEISTRYVRNLTVGAFGGSIRPDIGFHLDRNNTYVGFFYLRGFP
jgi:hypothetical protein